MRINSIKYAKSVRSDGGDTRFEAAALLDRGENADVAFEDLKKYVNEKLGLKSGAQEFVNNALADAFKSAAGSRVGVFADNKRHGESDVLTKKVGIGG